ncbi:MAG: hypothetical protein F9K29_23765 [Hyphomicrobiaceae bacterium]|nr:MAG: hypothetical protein F9K29_23765 [Hyphomicrobiaceae bacterium]
MNDIELQHARTVPLATLRRFLTLNGWHQINDIKRGMDVYKLGFGSGPDVEIVLPQQTTGSDTLRRIAEALRTLSQIGEQDIAGVTALIRAVAIDVLRSTVPDALVRNEAIHLEVAEGFIRNVKQLLSAAATTELSPEPFFGRIKKEAKEFADECRFGHTFRGSFGFTIETPILPNRSPTLEVVEQTPPFERRVMQRIARGLKSVQTAVTEQDAAPIASNFRTGLSANMCEELADLAESIKGERLGFEFAFSPEWRVSPDIVVGDRYVVATEHVELIKDAAKRLRLQEFERDRTITGRIVRLKSDKDPSDLLNPVGAREITILWESSDFGEINIRVALPPAEYLQAVEAHKTGRLISVGGLIERIGKTWRLSQPRDFAILP